MRAITCLLTLGMLTAGAHADTILNAGVNGYYGNVNANQFVGESFTTSQTYADATVSVYLAGPAGSSGTAYLTTSVGPGTTVADQIAAVNFSPVSTTYTLQTLFSNVTLPTGTIYLTFYSSSPTSGITAEFGYPTEVTTAPGVSFDRAYQSTGGNAFPPASSVSGLGGDIGAVITGSPVPEPATFLLLLSSGVPLRWIRRRS